MKTTYLKPITEIVLISSGAIMIGASGEGKKILEDGGNTSTGNVNEGDSRRFSVWDDEDDEEEE